jgi:hypothetical protein
MPAVFRPPNVPPAELWTPLPKDPVFADLRQRRGGHYLTIVGRLKDGVPIARASRTRDDRAALARQYPKDNEGWGVRLASPKLRRRSTDRAPSPARSGRSRVSDRLRQRREPSARALERRSREVAIRTASEPGARSSSASS